MVLKKVEGTNCLGCGWQGNVGRSFYMRSGVVGKSVDGRLELALGDWDWSVVSGSGVDLGWYR